MAELQEIWDKLTSKEQEKYAELKNKRKLEISLNKKS